MGYVSKLIKTSCSTVQKGRNEEGRNLIQTHLGKILKKVLVFVFSYTGVEKTKMKNKSGKVLYVRIEI